MKKLQLMKKYVKRCVAGCGLAWALLTTVVDAAALGVWGNEPGAGCSVCDDGKGDNDPENDKTTPLV